MELSTFLIKKGVCIIEWPELIDSFDIENKYKILFKVNEIESSRTIEVFK